MKWTVNQKQNLTAYLLILPALLVFTVIVTIPMLQNIGLSLTNWDGLLSKPEYTGLQNYIHLLKDVNFYAALRVTLLFTIVVLLFQQAFAIFFAVMVEKNTVTNKIFRSILFIPCLLTTVVVGMVFSYVFNVNFGVFNLLCAKLGLTQLAGIDWLGDERFALLMCCFITIWQYAGYNMIIYLAALKNISAEYYESAELDGASPWRQFWHITFPLLAPALTVNSLITVIGCLKQFDIPFILTKGGPGNATQTVAILLYKDAFYNNNAGYVAAESFILILIVLSISVIQTKYLSAKEVNQ